MADSSNSAGTLCASTTPLATVVIPLFNGAATIVETLDSVLQQSRNDIEVVVVDDGSADGGVALVREHPVRAQVLAQPHLGVAVARNRGLAAARGRWIAFLDQDDLWHPSHLERACEWLEQHPDERILMTSEIAFSSRDEIEKLSEQDPLVGTWSSELVTNSALPELVEGADLGTGDVTHHDVEAMLRGPISVTTSFVADPQVLRLAGGFAPHALAMDDYWLLVNVARLTPIPRIDQRTVFYRVHVNATSRSTRLGLAFLSSAVALRLGGGLVPTDKALTKATTGPLHEHLLGELLDSPSDREPEARRVTDHLARLLWPPNGRVAQRWRARIGRRVPWLRRGFRRLKAKR
ncbi:Glycosyl transferase family 2 [Paramicrobacterium humi]|uniref:Glycosyl transferase family 2 n=1 Tax=Paramicrobacterium humi TaxID=640635 RepID=A0A1H4MLT7_9MICO|nr:glycosyltransferase family A protein [Microbacterium humi]SEB83807.1 Glycosyl transferase family 2 [Microbacterium humi]